MPDNPPKAESGRTANEEGNAMTNDEAFAKNVEDAPEGLYEEMEHPAEYARTDEDNELYGEISEPETVEPEEEEVAPDS